MKITDLKISYTPEMQAAAKAAAATPTDDFLTEVEDNLHRLEKKQEGLIEPRRTRPGK